MKKFIIPCACLVAIISLAGCSNTSDTQAITSLNNQLSRVESIVSSTNVNEVSQVSPSVTLASSEPYNSIQRFRALANENMLREEELRQKILNMNSQLKSCTDKQYKLGRNKKNALKDITNNLSKYSSNLNETKPKVKNSVSKIKKNLKVTSINIEEATSSYITLNNSMNERYAYLCNIYDNLEQACIILECPCENNNSCQNCKDNNTDSSEIEFENSPFIEEENTNEDNNPIFENIENNNTQEKGSFKIIKNIDTYGIEENSAQNTTVQNNQQNTSNLPQTTNQNTPPSTKIPLQLTTRPITPPRRPNYTPQPVPRPYPNNNYTNNEYGNFKYGYDRINPNRNTDTFYSLNRNIDTYRYNPINPNFYGYNYQY